MYRGEDGEFVKSREAVAIFIIMASFLTVFGISREINFHYQKKIDKLIKERELIRSQYPISPLPNYYDESMSYQSKKVNYENVDKLRNRKSVVLSIFWMIYGIILTSLGIAERYKPIRIGGLLLLIVAIFKLFFIDLWGLGTLYKIISSISLGVVLLSISFAYQKYKNVFKQII